MIDNFFDKFPTVRKWIDARHADFDKQGWVRSSSGRKLFLAGFGSNIPHIQAGGRRQAQNYPIQSFGSDITLLGMIIAHQKLRAAQLNSVPWEFTHDSVEFDVFPGELFDVLRIGKTSMERDVLNEYPNIRVPIVVEMEIGVRWDGTLAVTDVDYETGQLTLKGKKKWYDETIDQLKKTYLVTEIAAEVRNRLGVPGKEDLSG